MRSIVTIGLLLSCMLGIKAQDNVASQGFLFSPQVAYHLPTGHLASRFFNFNGIGVSSQYKFQNGIQIGLDYQWLFHDNIKEPGTFSEITAASQQIIDQDGHFAVLRLGMRGHLATANFGKLFTINQSNKNSGILLTIGGGFMQHRIDFLSSQNKIPQINGEYEKGYDKMTYGFASNQFVGYQYLKRSNRIHFKLGLEFVQGFTQGRRTWNFNENKSGLDKRFDGSVAIKGGIILPVYTKKTEDEEFFID